LFLGTPIAPGVQGQVMQQPVVNYQLPVRGKKYTKKQSNQFCQAVK